MKNILVFGAGRSAYYAILHLLNQAQQKGLQITIADALEENLKAWSQYPHAITCVADVHDDNSRRELVAKQDIIISLLPARFHNLVAEDCLIAGVHLITPSYVSPELEKMHDEVSKKGLVFINEMGLDPGIDHMSAMQIIHRLQAEGNEIISFKSNTGGLMALGSDDNPWRYKLSWNPYNVVRAGQDGALYRQNNELHYIPYHRLFREAELTEIAGEKFDVYLNRNSDKYISLYGLESAATFMRGTIRYEGFCRKWHLLLSLGLCIDRIGLPIDKPGSWEAYINMFMGNSDLHNKADLEMLSGLNLLDEDIYAIEWLCENADNVQVGDLTPAEQLQLLLEKKWQMQPHDKDRVIMVHELEYKQGEETKKLKSWLDLSGEDMHKTAMARTVGMPLAIAAILIAEGEISKTGLLMPTEKEVYEPMMRELGLYGIFFQEEESK